MPKDRPLSNLKRALGDFPAIISDNIRKQGRVTALEIGCGYGLPIIQLQQIFGHSITIYGINLNLQHCQRRKAVISGIKNRELSFITAASVLWGINEPNYLCADAGISLPFSSETFDFIYSRMALGFVKDKAQCIEEIFRVLRPGGSCRCDLSLIRWDDHPYPWNILFKVYCGNENQPFEVLIDRYFPHLQLKSTPKGKVYFEIQKKAEGRLNLGLEMISAIDLSSKQSDLIFYQSQYRLRK